jgi:hypothetical protein
MEIIQKICLIGKTYSNSKIENVEKKNNERKLFFGVNTKYEEKESKKCL